VDARDRATEPGRRETAYARAEGRRARDALLALESRSTLDFDDPALEWRRLLSEIPGTFLLVLASAGAAVAGTLTGGISRAAALTAPGLTVMAVTLFTGAVSGAHLNPVVSIAFALRRDFPWRRCFGYVLAQLRPEKRASSRPALPRLGRQIHAMER